MFFASETYEVDISNVPNSSENLTILTLDPGPTPKGLRHGLYSHPFFPTAVERWFSHRSERSPTWRSHSSSATTSPCRKVLKHRPVHVPTVADASLTQRGRFSATEKHSTCRAQVRRPRTVGVLFRWRTLLPLLHLLTYRSGDDDATRLCFGLPDRSIDLRCAYCVGESPPREHGFCTLLSSWVSVPASSFALIKLRVHRSRRWPYKIPHHLLT